MSTYNPTAQVQGESTGAAGAGIVVSATGLAVATEYARTQNPALYAYTQARRAGGTASTPNGPPWLLIGLAGAGALLWFMLSKKKGSGASQLSGYRPRRRKARR